MKTLDSKSLVRGVREEDGQTYVSFFSHSGYFRIPPSDQAALLKERLLEAIKSGQEISFAYDRDLQILKIY